MPPTSDHRSVRWLRGELPSLVSSGVISEENARAIERYYARQESGSRGFGFVLLAIYRSGAGRAPVSSCSSRTTGTISAVPSARSLLFSR